MYYFGVPFDEVGETQLEALIENEVSEAKNLDYKRDLPTSSDGSKKELLQDVSSFANTVGGVLLFGIEEEDGIPTQLVGVDIDSEDDIILKFESSIRGGIEPKLSSIQVRMIPLASGKNILAINIPMGWRRPHMVTYKNNSRFFARNSRGKYQLDISEIRRHIIDADASTRRLTEFRLERLSRVIGGPAPVKFPNTSILVLHVLPLISTNAEFIIELGNHIELAEALRPIGVGGWNNRYNLDGFTTFKEGTETDATFAYSQIFKNGCIESASTRPIYVDEGFIHGSAIEHAVLEKLSVYLPLLKEKGVSGPIDISLSLLNVEGMYVRGPGSVFSPHDWNDIDRRDLLLDAIVIDSPEATNYSESLQPLFDSLWRASGWPDSPIRRDPE